MLSVDEKWYLYINQKYSFLWGGAEKHAYLPSLNQIITSAPPPLLNPFECFVVAVMDHSFTATCKLVKSSMQSLIVMIWN